MAKLLKKKFVADAETVEDVQPEEVVVEEPVEAPAVVVEAPKPVIRAPVPSTGPAPNTKEQGHGGVYRSTGDGRRIALRRT